MMAHPQPIGWVMGGLSSPNVTCMGPSITRPSPNHRLAAAGKGSRLGRGLAISSAPTRRPRPFRLCLEQRWAQSRQRVTGAGCQNGHGRARDLCAGCFEEGKTRLEKAGGFAFPQRPPPHRAAQRGNHPRLERSPWNARRRIQGSRGGPDWGGAPLVYAAARRSRDHFREVGGCGRIDLP